MSTVPSRAYENNSTAQLAAQFNEFYLAITSPVVSQIGNYKIVEEIGEGAFGKVYLAQHVLLNAKVVLKCGLIDDPNIVREIYYHQQLKHKNIVKLYEVIKTEQHIWMALEYCEGGELFYYIYEQRRLDIGVCRLLFYQIVQGIKYVHSLNLSHRDLKLENILLADKKRLIIKLTDFGFVREFNPYKRLLLSTVCGTTAYMAPEMLKTEKYSGFAVDTWSMGVILYAMVYGVLPFDDDDDMKMKIKIMNEDPVLRTDNVDPEVVELIRKMLLKDPALRPSILEILNSPFLIDLTNEYLERRNSSINDTESIISINQHYKENKVPFQTRIERDLLKKLEKLNIDTDALQALVIQGHTNTLTAFYELGLTREFKKKKYKHKRRRYYEAKRQIKRSRKRVRSALSLADQNSGTQPLEKIISSLSITSKQPSENQPATSRKSAEEYRKLSTRASFNKRLSGLQLDSLGTQPPQTPVLPGAEFSHNSESSTNFGRQVSFIPDDRSTFSYQPTIDQQTGKGKKILGKLQFWKKARKDQGKVDEATSRNEYSDGENGVSEIHLGSKQDNAAERILAASKKSASPLRSVENNPASLVVNGGVRISGPEELPNPPEIRDAKELGHHRESSNQTANTNNTGSSHMSDHLDRTNNSIVHESLLSSGRRQRPESVVSQISQFSQLSQTYPMSESELEMLDGTDMDEDFYDDDAIYELSINTSQQDLLHNKHSSTSMAQSNSNALRKKRPSTSRMASDTLILTTSTQATGQQSRNKKHSLSQVSSNSSEDSESRSKIHDYGANADQRPVSPRQKIGFPRNGTHPSLRGPRQPNYGKAAPSPNVQTPTPVQPIPGNGMNRSPSPPIFKKFNTMSGVVKPVKNVFDPKKNDSGNQKWTMNGDMSDSRWRHDSATPSRIYERQAIITEEEEEDE